MNLHLTSLVLLAAYGPGLVAQKLPAPPAPTVKQAGLVKGGAQDGDPPQGFVAPKGGPGEGSGGNAWFDFTSRDLGTYFGQGEAVGEFKFKNPTEQTVEWSNIRGSCQCAKAILTVGDRRYRYTQKPQPRLVRVTQEPGKPEQSEDVETISIASGEEGAVEVHLDMHNITGTKQATLDIHSTDPAVPHTKLSFHAKGAQLFTILPSEVNLNKMTWNETREFTVSVSSPLQPDWNILRMDDAGDEFDVTWEKTMNNERASWTIKGKYGPVSGDTSGGGVLRFHSDINGSAPFTVRVLAFVQGPLEVKPGGFLTLGLIRKGKSLSREITFEPNDGIDLEATSLEFEKASLSSEFLTATSHKNGNTLVVELEISDKAPTGLVKGDLVVQLNHPLVKEKRIMFNGFVR